MWTEKYRAKKFTDLVGDERTHRSVLRWLKAWDPIVFPGSARPKPKLAKSYDQANADDEFAHRKILLLTGPPGLGKTTLAHVCARQAGYEIQEINASDERSKDIVKGRIKDMVGTENVRGVDTQTSAGAKVRKAGKPVCVVVDEVDGVVGGSGGGGEGGFIKALIDLVHLDQKNSGPKTNDSSSSATRKKKGDKFRLLRPLILICNDVYHPSLRPLRQASIAEIIHIRKPPVNMVVPRLHSIFQKEGIPADSDGVRRLCEATWGISSRKDGGGGGTGEGDVRGVMVVGEWVARKLLAETDGNRRLTRKWIEDNIINDLSHGGGAARGLGRGGTKEIVERIFKEGAGFPKSAAAAQAETANIEGTKAIGVAEATKRFAMDRLREMVNTAGDTDRVMTGMLPQLLLYDFLLIRG
ncbi:ATPase AAA+ type core [Neofusicoccum parvum]|nr:ATPase AAA+ type core [Neofusicoccum parvum]